MTAKNRNLSEIVLAGLIGLLAHSASAQTWQVVDDFLYSGGWGGSVQAMAKDSSGNIFAAGYTSVGDNVVGLIRKSSDGGAIWDSTLAFSNGEANPGYEYNAMTVDSAGTIYALGNNGWSSATAPFRWIVSRSTDGGQTWSTTEANVSAAWVYDSAQGIAVDAAGNVYAVGEANSLWTVRKSSDGGNAWTTADSFNSGFGSGYRSHATAVLCHPTAGIFVTGYGWVTTSVKGKTTSQKYWFVRRSLDSGATWTTVDSYAGGNASAIGAVGGNISVAGGNGSRWIVRESSNDGATWATTDDFQPCVTTVISTKPYRTQTQCYNAFPRSLAVDASGNVFAVGVAGSYNSTFGQHWMMRAKPVGSGAWQTADTFQYLPGSGTENQAYSILVSDSGNLVVGGVGSDSSWNYHWLVRKY